MKHYILTRWNQLHDNSHVYNFKGITDPEKWNEERMNLFEKYCLFSVNAQVNKDFTWVLAFNSKTPKKYYEKYQKYPYIKIIFDMHPFTYMNKIYGKEIKKGDWIATTRLDNDDCLHPNYIKEVKSKFDNKYALVDTAGCQFDVKNNTFHDSGRRYPNSPFLTVFEKAGEFSDHPIHTAYYKSHTNLHLSFKGRPQILISDKGKLYCQIIHDNNVCNKINGEKIYIKNNFFK
jgi:hypothetical protein